MVRRIVTACHGPEILNVGCGTGIEARQFQAAGCAVLGVEPDARMADVARCSGVEVEVATFEAWEPTRRELLDLLPTQGLLTRLPRNRVAEVLENVGEAIDAAGGGVTMCYSTVAVTAVRNPG